MMDVQIMRHIVDDVEEGMAPDVAQAAVRQWGGQAGVDSLTYLRSSANHVFRFLRESQPCFLRLAHETERRRSFIEAELDFVQHVADAGLAVARPVASANGWFIEEVSGKGHRYFAVVFEGLQGRELELDEMDEGAYRAWGHALALLHSASQTFPAHPARPAWRDELRATLDTLPAEETAVAQILAAGLAWLRTLTIQDTDYGLIHGDFELDNLVWDGARFQALDFDDAAYAWYAVDFAAALQDVWLADDMSSEQRDQRIVWFTEGYAALRPLPDRLREAMPRLMMLIQALKVARLLRSYATTGDTTGDDASPAWLAKMSAAHQQWFVAKRAALVWE